MGAVTASFSAFPLPQRTLNCPPYQGRPPPPPAPPLVPALTPTRPALSRLSTCGSVWKLLLAGGRVFVPFREVIYN